MTDFGLAPDSSETIGGRIRIARGGVSQAEFSAKLGVDKSLLGKYERNQSIPGGEFLAHLHKITGVDLTWLLTGNGGMYSDPTKISRPPLDEELGALIADGISKIYKDLNARLAPADLGRITARMLGDAMSFEDVAQRPAFVAGALGMLRRELQKPIDTDETKRLA